MFHLLTISLKQWFSTKDSFASLGHLATSGDVFGCLDWVGGAIWGCGGQGGAHTPPHTGNPTTESCGAQVLTGLLEEAGLRAFKGGRVSVSSCCKMRELQGRMKVQATPRARPAPHPPGPPISAKGALASPGALPSCLLRGCGSFFAAGQAQGARER